MTKEWSDFVKKPLEDTWYNLRIVFDENNVPEEIFFDGEKMLFLKDLQVGKTESRGNVEY